MQCLPILRIFFFVVVGNGLTGLRGEDKKFYVSFEEITSRENLLLFCVSEASDNSDKCFFFFFFMDCSVADRNFRFFVYNSPIMYNKFALACTSCSSKQSP